MGSSAGALALGLAASKTAEWWISKPLDYDMDGQRHKHREAPAGITPATAITPDEARNSEPAPLPSSSGSAAKSAVIVIRLGRGRMRRA